MQFLVHQFDDLGFMTGITGSSGSPALGADIRSRASGGDQRKLYNACTANPRKDAESGHCWQPEIYGASGINTVAEAKMYFQGMPQVDFSSPEALQQSMRDIQQYTDNYNQQYNVNVGNGGKKSSMQQPATQQSAGGSYTSKIRHSIYGGMMKVTANGKTFTFPDGTSTEDIGTAIDEYFAGQAVQQQTVNQANNEPAREEPSLMQQAGDWLTGESKCRANCRTGWSWSGKHTI